MPNLPVVASYVADFLKLDQMHVYRQITGVLGEIDMHVFTHRRENERTFGFDPKRVHALPKPRTRWLRRLVYKQWRQEPWQIYRGELRRWLLDLTRIDAQVLHVYFGHVAPQFLPLMKAWRKPVVVSFHGADAGLDLQKPGYRAAQAEVFRLATKVQVRSEALGEDLVRMGCPPDKVVLQRTGVPMEGWPYQERFPPEDGAWRLMQSCRFISKKGLDTTLQAFALIAAQHPRARLSLVGDGPLRAALEVKAGELGVADRVEFTGFLANTAVARAVYASHLYFHPSRTTPEGDREGVPNAMLEAMASGVPVLATRHGGIPEAVIHEKSGLLVDENDAPALAAAALRLMEDPGLRRQIGLAGHESVQAAFARDAQSKRLAAFYKELMAPDCEGN
ncbi:MAG: hypothetical protein JWO94_467 [Verrucomicrobiaceae bacterium]|nr:hypothetical protein [Verrucomicrobiaceae bacterium]